MIQDILVSDSLIREAFACQLDKCKGACCKEGDYGAPLDEEEVQAIHQMIPTLRQYLEPEGLMAIDEHGPVQYFSEPGFHGATLREDGSCAYMVTDAVGIAHCGIEKAWADGAISWQKPVSCHLYPVRVKKIEHMNFEALNYDRWDICAAACQNGKELGIPIYQFVKDALIRKYGEAFWNELDDAAHEFARNHQNT